MAGFVIAGGGIAGIAAALALADRNHEITVLEQAPAFEEVGAGIQIGPNGRRALEALGVWDVLEPAVVFPQSVRVRRARDGAVLGELPLGTTFANRFGTTYQVVHRADLLAALVEVAESSPRINLRTGGRVSCYRANDGGMTALLEDGGEQDADVLIGADGIRSRIRAQLLDDGPPVFAGHVLYRALVDIEAVPSDVDTTSVNLWLHEGGHVVHYPVSGGRKFNIVTAVNENWHSEGWSEPSDGAILGMRFAAVAEELSEVLALPGEWLRWAGADREPVGRWGRGPVTLIGDAAHPTLPYLASGAVMALEDAVVLGREVERSPADLPAALRAYEKARQPRTARIVRSSHRLAGIYHAGPPLSFFRDVFIRMTSGRRGLERMAWLYDWRP